MGRCVRLPHAADGGSGEQFSSAAGVEKTKCRDSDIGQALTKGSPGSTAIDAKENAHVSAQIQNILAAGINQDRFAWPIRETIGAILQPHPHIPNLEETSSSTHGKSLHPTRTSFPR